MTTHMPQYGNAAPAELAEQFRKIHDTVHAEVERAIKGKSTAVRLAITCFFAGGHLLIEDVPGTGKTSLAKSLAAAVAGDWHRVQFTPDLLPSDITGVSVWDESARRFDFREGPVFSNVVLADEINRASPKTQSALLEVMEENQVTVDGVGRPVPTRSWWWRRRTRSIWKAPTSCRRRSWTGS